jgi:hypothetical protein
VFWNVAWPGTRPNREAEAKPIVPTSWKRAGYSTVPSARATLITPSSSGWRSASSAGRTNSGSSSSRSTPRWARPYLFYNLACCESLAGRTADAIEHLRMATEMWEDCRGMARDDPDFDSIRDLPAFQELANH